MIFGKSVEMRLRPSADTVAANRADISMSHKSTEPFLRLDEEKRVEFTALQSFMLRSTVPIMAEIVDKKPIPQGTGTLFRLNERHFIVTAKHIFKSDYDSLSSLAIPDGLTGTSFTRIIDAQYTRPSADAFDVAVVEITNRDSVEAIKHNWNFLTLDNVQFDPPRTPVWIVGFPEDADWLDQTKPFMIKSITVVTELLTTVPPDAEPPVHIGLDLFFLYDKHAHVLDRGLEPTPELFGVSGASIWELSGQPQNGELWLPEKFAKAVAVQSSFRHSKYIRGKSWLAVAKMLAKMDDELKTVIFEKTGIIRD